MSSLPSHNNAGQGALREPRGTCARPLQGAGDSQPTAELPACPSRAGPWRWTRGLRRYIGDEEQESSFPTLCSQEQSAGGRLHATLNSTCIHTLTLVLERLNPSPPRASPKFFLNALLKGGPVKHSSSLTSSLNDGETEAQSGEGLARVRRRASDLSHFPHSEGAKSQQANTL